MISGKLIDNYVESLGATVQVNDPVWKAWRIMKENKLKSLPVMKNEKIVGLVSDRDIVQISGYNGGQSMPVKDAMSLDPLVLYLGTTMDQALEAMMSKDQVHAVVVDEKGQVCGIFSWDKAFQFFLNFAKISSLNRKMSS